MSKTVSIILVSVIILGIVLIIYGYFNSKKCKDSDTPFKCIKKKGAKPTTVPSAGNRYDYPTSEKGSYGFYDNNRVVVIGASPEKKGTYDKEKITWDNGGVTLIENIFTK